MKDWLLVDGYNVINHWPEFKLLREENLEHARELLLTLLAEYGAFKGENVILVFDALEVCGVSTEQRYGDLLVVFTGEGETADSWIERRTYELRNTAHKTFVVTSDFAEQIAILGFGAYRISAREFRAEWLLVKKQIAEHQSLKKPSNLARNEIGSRLQGNVLAVFEDLRRKR
ncbi:MAG: NYN domain-containing protein [Acidaminococcaceae bacterium]